MFVFLHSLFQGFPQRSINASPVTDHWQNSHSPIAFKSLCKTTLLHWGER